MKLSLLSFVALVASAGASFAQVPSDLVRAELLHGWRGEDGVHHAGLKLTLKPGWKTYWRAPGDGGIPPLFDWSGSDNVTGASAMFPRPTLFSQAGLTTVGYTDEVIFPLAIATRTHDAPAMLSLRVELGLCEEVCVPATIGVSGMLSTEGTRDPEIASAMVDVPAEGGPMTCEVSPITDGLALTARGVGAADHVVVEAGMPEVWVSPADVEMVGGAMEASVEMVPPEGAPFALDRSRVRITVFSGGEVFETVGCD